MKRISIFNEKGGSGKSTTGILLASYLAYSLGKRVCVLDFDAPTFHFSQIRDGEMELKKNPKTPLSIWLRDSPPLIPYDIYKVPTTSGGAYDYDDILDFILAIPEEDYDYLIYDFPGRFSEEEPVALLAANGMIDFVAVPMDTDTQSRKSALVVSCAMLESGVPVVTFWNRVTRYENSATCERFKKGLLPFAQYGIPVMNNYIREIRTFSRDSDEMLFVRSTLCFPDRFIMRRCPFMFDFLKELVSLIDTAGEQTNSEIQ